MYYLGVDQGTTGTTALILDANWNMVSSGYKKHTQFYPKPGWVEHDPLEILESVKASVDAALHKKAINPKDIKCIGVDNQGETVMVWDKKSGQPVYNAIVWQDRRTAGLADKLKESCQDRIRAKTGLVVDAYFSATKLKWILENVAGAKQKAAKGELLAGTLDTWLLWKLSGGKIVATDYSTASRTMLLNIHTGCWDSELLNLLEIPKSILPTVYDSAMVYGYTSPAEFFGVSIPISGSIVDQQAALLGQACLKKGSVKTTYGTGCFMLMNTGSRPVYSQNGLLTTIAWRFNEKMTYALEGGAYTTGAAIQWLKDGLGIIQHPAETESLALSVRDTAGLYFVPAFVGLAAPYWDQYARGMIIGITSGTSQAHIVRATLESIAFQVRENLDVMRRDSDVALEVMRADGGIAVNEFLMQFQADILGMPVDVPVINETSALGSAYLAALGIGELGSLNEISLNRKLKKRYEPQMGEDERQARLYNWKRAVERAKAWVQE